jgi:primosomal protein N' (replication factor Y)
MPTTTEASNARIHFSTFAVDHSRMSDQATFVDVIIPIAIPNLLTYRVTRELEEHIRFGQRVIVQLGRSKLYTAVVHKVHNHPPKNYEARYIEYLLDDVPLVNKKQMKLWEWMASYYLCTLGEVVGMALPSSLKLASESKVVLNQDFQAIDTSKLNDNEFLILEALELRKELTIAEISEILGIKTVQPLIKRLIEYGQITTEEELKQRYKPKTEAVVLLAKAYHDEELLHDLCQQLEKRAVKQLDVLMAYLREDADYTQGVARATLHKVSGSAAAAVKSLIEKGVFDLYERHVDRLSQYDGERSAEKDLSEAQDRALQEVKTAFETKEVVLLHGVTGSGKTEIYVRLISETIARGEQVLYLLPEIALTTQLITRLQRYFGDQVGVYHSRFNQQERAETWFKTMRHDGKGYPIIIGARSAVFLPYDKLGLIIVDEEHEPSFKQYDPAPRYNGKDTAIVLGVFHGAKVLLGSATPSIETYFNAQEGRYGLVTLNQRFGDVVMPEIQCADMRKELKRKTMRENFTGFLIEAMEATLREGKQIILFQNRRGYAPMWQCHTCGWIPECTRCDVSLTYHKRVHHLNCHYCGYTESPPTKCKACGSTDIRTVGFGTEKIEEDLETLLPKARVARMDLDTTRSKHAYSKLLTAFGDGEIDILVGTQMVTKGLDFDNVALVGVLNADILLRFPDFRSMERAFQLMVQVSGRSGRKKERGQVVIQTYDPEHWVIRKVIDYDYEGLYRHELIERKKFLYPPFVRLIRLSLRHKDKHFLKVAALEFANDLRAKIGDRVIGPEAPFIERINNMYHQNILLKLERDGSPAKFKLAIQDVIDHFKADQKKRAIRIVPDVDPA